MFRLVVLALALALALLTSAFDLAPIARAAGRSTGQLRGTVRLTAGAGTASTATAYARRSVAPRPKVLPEARNVVISLVDGPPATSRAPRPRVEMTQRDEQFVPRVVAIETGTTVAFPNDDPYFHNVFSLSRQATFDLGRYPSGDTRTRVFDKPGIVKVYCHLHAQMSALIRVFDHPWFTIPDAQGQFALEDVPAGTYTLAVWHERIGERREPITIRPGASTEVSFTLPVLETAN